MIKLSGLIATPVQTFFTRLPTGQRINFELRYLQRVQEFYLSIYFEDRVYRNIKMTSVPNILEQLSNILPFGVYCDTIDGIDPFLLNDFSTGRCTLYIIEKSELLIIKSLYEN